MAATEKNSVMVELYDLSITEQKDDRFGRVVTSKSLSEKDLVNIAVTRRTDLNATTLKAAMEILKEIAIEKIANGASVNFGLGYFRLGVNGVFIGDNARWDNSKHSLSVRVTPNSGLRQTINSCTAVVRGMAATGLAINSITDISSGEVNSRLTPGGGVNLTGSKIKIEGNDARIGIKLINQDTQEETPILMKSILINDPSKITFIVPEVLANGDYTLVITTQFGNSGSLLKEARTYTADYIFKITS
jgi:hypothetical protein